MVMVMITCGALSASIAERVVIEDIIQVAQTQAGTFVVIVCWHVLQFDSLRLANYFLKKRSGRNEKLDRNLTMSSKSTPSSKSFSSFPPVWWSLKAACTADWKKLSLVRWRFG